MAANIKKLTLYPDKDFDIIRLCELITQAEDVNFSELTTFAVENYLRTGKYITIGYVFPKHYNGQKIAPKNIYVKKNTLFEQWASANKNTPGFILTNRVRAILHASIQLVDNEAEETVISLYDMMLELRKNETEQPLFKPMELQNTGIERSTAVPPAPVQREIKEVSKPMVETKQQQISQTSNSAKREPGLNSMFLGGRTLKLDE